MEIRNSEQLRSAWEMLRFYEDNIEGFGKPEYGLKRIKELKGNIREYNRKSDDSEIVKDYGIDGYIEKIKAPEWCDSPEDVDEWFDACVRIRYRWSPYDCTGQLFTMWSTPVKLHGDWYVYHGIGCDV